MERHTIVLNGKNQYFKDVKSPQIKLYSQLPYWEEILIKIQSGSFYGLGNCKIFLEGYIYGQIFEIEQ